MLGTLAVLVLAFGQAPAANAQPLHERIDASIEQGMVGTPAPVVDDATFCRRIYLDLCGRVPSVAEALAFVVNTKPKKRTELVDALLASPEFARQLAVWLDVTLMERRADKNVPTAEWRKYLFDSAAANKPYDQLVREILSADGADPATRPAAKFYLDRDGEPFALTRDVGRMLFGMDLQCAQCHDHPLVSDYHQEDYHGLLAFLNRTTLFTDAESKVSLAEKAEGETNYQSVFDPDQKGSIGPTLPGGLRLSEPTFAKGDEYAVAPADKVRSVPKHSRRSLLAVAATDGKNRAFNRNIANRLWALMLGRGLVEPLDFQHADNPPTQPELLELLADEIVVMKYDLRAFLREVALSKAYARSLDLPGETPQLAAESAGRVAEFEEACQQCQQASNGAAESARAARAAVDAVQQQEQATLAETVTAQTALAAAEQAIKDAQAAMAKAQTELAAKQALAQTLTDAAAKTAEAASQLPEDQELAAALATVKNRGEAITTALAGLSQTMTQCQADMGTKEAAAAAQRLAVEQSLAKVESARSQVAPLANAWEAAVKVAAHEQGLTAGAQQRLSWIKAMTAYRAAIDAAEAQRAAQATVQEQLVAAMAAAKSSQTLDQTAIAGASDDLAGAQIVLASVRQELSVREQLAARLSEAVAQTESSQAALATAQAALDEAYAKVQARWSDRCLAGGLTQLTPEQMAWSTWQALGVLDQQRTAAGAEWDAAHPADGAAETPEQRAVSRAAFVEQKVYDNLQGSVGTFVNLFGGAPGQPQQVFQATADQALFFANGGELRSWMAPGGGNLSERLIQCSDPQRMADELYFTMFTRQPTPDEVEGVKAYMSGREQDRAAAVQEMIWALVTSAEFRFGS